MEKCPLCKGRGMQVHIQQIGPGMVQQIQTVCIECKGQGERIDPKDRCESCCGAKVVREKKVLEVHVERGEAVRAAPPRRRTHRSGAGNSVTAGPWPAEPPVPRPALGPLACLPSGVTCQFPC